MIEFIDIPAAAGGVYVNLDREGNDRLELVIEQMQTDNPELTIDDCVDAIFSIGLISTFSTLTVLQAVRPDNAELAR